ncbi:non-hydrolyzing UDP-N-acetylglucosamine 2-epimerase [Oceanotoga teriensis]|uniref:non-hydrolyzing UDP-N-acetylglucosamine 2-epimerase n=1 Tax=Oceanotoga teriensis TaxID=515440 RepID=UPI002713369A|nr:UDP-N-acetylglucosamine 2-epimerase (non-hydrolyzing) [Oceanotoga teriensis]MDO7975812.1 UDP-N-acetylglucosamine 2-epimerase (non-hydrolyzing) [Oceanotoga teriensis]
MKIISIVGARPQFIKEAVINKELEKKGIKEVLVHSGQHYDSNMSEIFFNKLKIKNPDYNLNVGSGTHAQMTAKIMIEFEEIVKKENPDIVLVYGDTNTTLAGAIVASKLKIPVAHIEAGIRQEPKDMPEEINRVMTDSISKYLFCASKSSVENLKKENKEGIFVGDTMYDLYKHMEETFNEGNIKKYGLKKENYILATIHRDFNTDKKEKLEKIIDQLNKINDEMQVVIPLHPRTKNKIQEFQLKPEFKIIEPLGYIEIQSLAKYSKFVVTDSGGLQKEAYYGGKRSIVVMPDTGWRELVENKWNKLSESDEIYEKYNQMKDENVDYPDNVYGDGDCSSRIVDIISKFEG